MADDKKMSIKQFQFDILRIISEAVSEDIHTADMFGVLFDTDSHRDIRVVGQGVIFQRAGADLYSVQISPVFGKTPGLEFPILGIFIGPPVGIQFSPPAAEVRRACPGAGIQSVYPQGDIRGAVKIIIHGFRTQLRGYLHAL